MTRMLWSPIAVPIITLLVICCSCPPAYSAKLESTVSGDASPITVAARNQVMLKNGDFTIGLLNQARDGDSLLGDGADEQTTWIFDLKSVLKPWMLHPQLWLSATLELHVETKEGPHRSADQVAIMGGCEFYSRHSHYSHSGGGNGLENSSRTGSISAPPATCLGSLILAKLML